MARSTPAPVFLSLDGAKLTVILTLGNGKPELRIAARVRSARLADRVVGAAADRETWKTTSYVHFEANRMTLGTGDSGDEIEANMAAPLRRGAPHLTMRRDVRAPRPINAPAVR